MSNVFLELKTLKEIKSKYNIMCCDYEWLEEIELEYKKSAKKDERFKRKNRRKTDYFDCLNSFFFYFLNIFVFG